MSPRQSANRVAIVGAGHAGGRVAQHLRALGHAGSIALIGDEAHAPYERPALSKELLLGAKSAGDLTLTPHTFWTGAADDTRIERHHARAQRLLADERRLQLDDGSEIPFDHLVIATGGAARRAAIDGAELPGIVYLRTIDDGLALKAALRHTRSLAIIGAGVIGMEVAASASQLGVAVTVLEAGERVMARSVPPVVSAWIAALHREHGVVIETGVRVESISRGADNNGSRALTVSTSRDGRTQDIHADLVLIAVGIECDLAFLDGTGIASKAGIPVDEYCRSPLAPWCYAAGDVANTFNAHYGRSVRLETWRNAENQARAVAEFIVGRTEPYVEIPWMWTDQFGHNIQVVGLPEAGDTAIVRGEAGLAPATVVMVRNGRVTGGVMIDQGRDRRYLEALLGRVPAVSPVQLADPATPLKRMV
jgi:3-phenylpropionate/trans-cinnamate dioxygenase ferredoxin reductase component